MRHDIFWDTEKTFHGRVSIFDIEGESWTEVNVSDDRDYDYHFSHLPHGLAEKASIYNNKVKLPILTRLLRIM